jgi:gamma-glutamylcyclotransferase (GGCT)/AIG2-like uncharacterized protein YtfP
MDVFVYGTLTDPERVGTVLSSFEFRGPATLDGLHRVEGTYPTLAPGGRVTGRVLRTTETTALDAYEGVESGLYVRVAVPRGDPDTDDDGDGSVETYVGDPAALDAEAEWPGTGSFGERVRRFLRENEVVVRARDGHQI